MKNIILGLLLFGAVTGSLTSCKRDQNIPAPGADTLPLVLPQISSDPNKQFYNLTSARASVASNPVRPVVEFTLNPADVGTTKLESVLVYKSFRRGGVLGPRALAGEYSSFPAVVSLNSQEVLTGLTRSGGALLIAPASNPNQINPLLSGDVILFTFDYKLTDGRTIVSTPTDATGTIIPTYTLVNAPYSLTAAFRI